MNSDVPDLAENRSITIIPENYEQIDSQKRKVRARTFFIYAAVLLLGGIGYKAWLFYQDWQFKAGGAHAIGTIESWETHTTYSKRKALPTHTIKYQFKTESDQTVSGEDYVKIWRHKPESKSGLEPKKKEDIRIEYLKADPQLSRIIIPNRFDEESFWSTCAILKAGFLSAILWINSFSTKLRLQSYGCLLMLVGCSIVAGLIYILIAEAPIHRLGEGILALLVMLIFVSPFVGGALWLGWFLFSISHFTFTDPRELLRDQVIPPCGDQVTIMPRKYLGADAALILDHQNGLIHFLNCHVAKGFIPRTMRIYTCKIDDLHIDGKNRTIKPGQITHAILSTPAGATRLEMQEPGAIEILGILRNQG